MDNQVTNQDGPAVKISFTMGLPDSFAGPVPLLLKPQNLLKDSLYEPN